MQYKAVITDLDGTLIRWEGELTPMSREVLKRLEGRGIAIIVATARPPRYAVDYIEGIPKDSWYICYNGAEIYRHGKCLYKRCVNAKMTAELIGMIRRMDEGFVIAVETDNRIFADSDLVVMFGQSVPYEAVDWEIAECMAAAKVLVSHEDLSMLVKLKAELPNGVKGMITDGGTLMHVVHEEVDKAVAADWIMGKLGITMDQAVAFGDDTIDITMIQRAGIGVAIEGAQKEIIEAADRICQPPEEDGVAKVIKEIVLGDNKDEKE